MDPNLFFDTQLAKNRALESSFKKAATRVASVRLIVFISAIPTFIYFVNARELPLALLVVFFFAVFFIILIRKHNKLKTSRDHHRYLVDINSEEIARLNGDLSTVENGEEFSVKDHPYAEDLDILGNHSIYQMLNRTSIYPGKKLLADRLLGNKTVEDLTQYQQSVKEMAKMPELVQTYQALGRYVKASRNDYDQFKLWLAIPAVVTNLPGIKYWIYLLPILVLLGVGIATILSITYYIILPIVIVNLILLSRQHKYAREVISKTSASLVMLKSFVKHIELVQSEKFSSKYLITLANSFSSDGHDAKVEIGRIAGLLENLQERNNMLHIFFNIPLLLDYHWLVRIEQWQAKNSDRILRWFETLAEFEVLNSLAAQSFANPNWTYPELSDTPYHIDAQKLAHPLIFSTKNISNDFVMQNKGEIILLTGPNMAGKSTFLRAVGVNIVLAKLGGAVNATDFVFDPEMQVFTGMRVKDDLSENVSSFYAELARIKLLLNLAEQGKPVVYFLDEILKGTNSADRHKGAEALIKQLSLLGVSGFVSTHDLALGEMARELDSVRNFSFESSIENGEINFDYKLRPGICSSFNACELMRQMGIKV